MNIYSITDHADDCYYYMKNTFCFQYAYDFHCVIYCQCMQKRQHHLDWKLDLIKTIAKKVGKAEKFNRCINKGNDLKNAIKNNKVSALFDKDITEVNAIYLDNAMKSYCYGTEHSFTEYLSLSVNYRDNFHKATSKIKSLDIFDKDEYDVLFSQLCELHRHNVNDWEFLTDIQKTKLTKLLIKNYDHTS
jgi:hypothetical protein